MLKSRADALNTSKITEFFSDFYNDFSVSPANDQLGRITNERAVNQSIKNLIQTQIGERLYQPDVGAGINRLIFEINDYISTNKLKNLIQNTLENNEPRIVLLNVEVSSSDHEVQITIYYNLINNSDPIKFEFMLKRVR